MAEHRAPITGGSDVATCGWPSAVYLSGGGHVCSGVLIHPELVATAAHCGTGFGQVVFGEDRHGTSVPTVECIAHELYAAGDESWDFAVCRLTTPMTDVDRNNGIRTTKVPKARRGAAVNERRCRACAACVLWGRPRRGCPLST